MTSAINTGAIDGTYPIPGVNNSSQGFRTNFSTIKTNLNTAASEITELQSKGIFKSALTGTVLDNNMDNALISNAVTQGFSQVAYNLGSNIAGSVTIDKAFGDFQYGVVSGNITAMTFTNWAPSGNYSEVTVSLSVNPGTTIVFPYQVSANSLATIENTSTVNGITTLTVPAATFQLTLKFYTIDCGTTIQVAPVDRPRKTTQLIARNVSSNTIGSPGDVAGDVAYSNGSFWLCNRAYTGTSQIWNTIGGGGSATSLVSGNSNVVVDVNGAIRFGSQGNANVFTVNGNSTTVNGILNANSNLNITGSTTFNAGTANSLLFPSTRGTNGQVLQSVGDGTMVWGDVSGGAGATIGGTNGTIQFNNNGNFAGSNNLTFNSLTNFLTFTGTANIGNVLLSSTSVTANGSSTFGNINVRNVTISNSLNITANISATNINATGNIRASNIVSVGTGAVGINSSTTINLNTPNANVGGVFVSGAANLNLSGNLIMSTGGNLFLRAGNVIPGTTFGTAGQIVLDLNGNRIWVSYGGTNWKSASLI